MVYVDPEFEIPTVPDDEKYEGTEIDKHVLEALPSGSRIIWVSTHGASFWAISYKIDTELPDGSKKSYFLKAFIRENGQSLAKGEYESTVALYSVIPDNVPQPITTGAYASNPKKHFYLAEYRDMVDELPPVPELAALIANLHQKSASPNGKFGFAVPTSQSLQLDNAWCDTWEEFFTRAVRGTVKLEQSIQGQNEELDQLTEQLCEKVIPRLLRPMESGGRQLKPTLVHGDLWHGNVGVDVNTDQPVLFDCCAFYGHHEYDLGMFRAARYRTNKAHIRAYQKLVDISEPVEDYDDRNALYALRVDLEVSCGWPANKRMRHLAMDEMQRLIAKYPDGINSNSVV